MLDTSLIKTRTVAAYGLLRENGSGVEACDESGAVILEQDVEFSSEPTQPISFASEKAEGPEREALMTALRQVVPQVLPKRLAEEV